jgi:VCBS repeat-containing protein
MTTYTHNEIAVPGGAQWYDVNIDGNNPITRTSTLFVLPNSDGTATHIIGSDFTYDANGNPTGGLVTQIDRTSSDGATVYETVTGLEPIYLYYTPLGGSDAGNPLLAFAFENDLVSVFSLLTNPSFGFGLIYSLCDTLNGFSGDDLFFGGGPTGSFSKSFDGGSGGTDTVSYENTLGVRADLDTGGAGGDTYTSIENLIGSFLSDSLFGNSSVNVLSGGLGNDLLDGKGGDDAMIGGAGDDIYLVDSTSDLVTENAGEGNDIVFASVDYTLGPNIEKLGRLVSGDATVIGGAGDDLYFVDSTSDVVMENPGEGNDTVYAIVDYTIGPNIEGLVLFEGAGDINGLGNNLNNVLVGSSGHNVLDGKGGDDAMIGGFGNDTYYVDSTNDLVIENATHHEGTDIVFASVDYTIGPNIERLTLVEGAGNINGSGNNDDYNTLVGNSGNNTLYGMGGLDRMYGGAGNDTLYGGDGNDVELDGGTGDDTMIGGAGSDRYYVDSTSDLVIENPGEGFELVYASADYTIGPNIEALTLVNGAGDINGWGNDINNELSGNYTNNVLDGKGGQDFLEGRSGNDTFVFAAGEADGDVVGDFISGEDSLLFLGFGTAAGGATFTQIGGATNQWQIHSGLDGHDEVITFRWNYASVLASDYVFQDAPGNTAPVATADSYLTNEDEALNIAAAGVLLNDRDADNDALTAVLVSNVQHGTLALNANGSFSYMPDANYNGPDRFTYKAIDESASSDVTTVSITVSAVSDAPADHDFNGDGNSDVVWRDDSGRVYFWGMTGLQTNGEGSVAHAPVTNDWHIQGSGDFNGDGKSDLLWRHDSGQVYLWEMDGLQIKGEGSPPHAPVPNDWHIEGTDDFNGDGNSDILWRHDSGQVYLWEMNGLQVKAEGAVAHASVPKDWHVQGMGDFNGDGSSDILWRHDSGQVYLWEMDGQQIKGEGSPPHAPVPNDWHIQGVGDFDGDGKSDLLWRHDNGQVYIWEMNGSQVKAEGTVVHAGVPNDWHVQDVGDFNGDGNSDILWRHDSGQLYVWEMNGLQVQDEGTVVHAPVPNDWHILA